MSFDLDITYLAIAGALTLRLAIVTATLPLLDRASVPLLWRLAVAAALAGTLAPAILAVTPPITSITWPLLIIPTALPKRINFATHRQTSAPNL